MFNDIIAMNQPAQPDTGCERASCMDVINGPGPPRRPAAGPLPGVNPPQRRCARYGCPWPGPAADCVWQHSRPCWFVRGARNSPRSAPNG